MFSIDGLASGLDTTSIIKSLLSAKQAQLDNLTAQKNVVLTKQSAFKGIEAKLISLKNTLAQISSARSEAFSVRNITSSNESLVTAAASKDAVPGTYQLRVKQLAQAEQIVSATLSSAETTIQQGTLDIRVGTHSTASITIDDQNNTVSGLVNAINSTSTDVTASLVNDGTGVRIILSSKYSAQRTTSRSRII